MDMEQKIKDMITNADLVLIGIGEEFEGIRHLKNQPDYCAMIEKVENADMEWLIPAINQQFSKEVFMDVSFYEKALKALKNLSVLLKDKNYFVVTVATNDVVWEAGFKTGKIVAPCGGSFRKQSKKGQESLKEPIELTLEEKENLYQLIKVGTPELFRICLPEEEQGILNNIYAANYDERGYLTDWQTYTRWLQGTLNKKVCILELGVGMQYPSVIRFPFEKELPALTVSW